MVRVPFTGIPCSSGLVRDARARARGFLSVWVLVRAGLAFLRLLAARDARAIGTGDAARRSGAERHCAARNLPREMSSAPPSGVGLGEEVDTVPATVMDMATAARRGLARAQGLPQARAAGRRPPLRSRPRRLGSLRRLTGANTCLAWPRPPSVSRPRVESRAGKHLDAGRGHRVHKLRRHAAEHGGSSPPRNTAGSGAVLDGAAHGRSHSGNDEDSEIQPARDPPTLSAPETDLQTPHRSPQPPPCLGDMSGSVRILRFEGPTRDGFMEPSSGRQYE